MCISRLRGKLHMYTGSYKGKAMTSTIENIQHVIELGTTSSIVWFRGHSKTHNELVPGIFRLSARRLDGISRIFYFGESFSLEYSVIEAFRRRAPALEKDFPAQEEHLQWLFFMQHYGLPTRLLDWTESILVALYFVVFENTDSDGEIWILSPEKLNALSGMVGMPTSYNRDVRFLASEPMYAKPEILLEELNIEIPKYPIAIRTPLTFPRIVNQRSVFTIHPDTKEGKSLPEVLEKKFLVRYIVPADAKPRLKKELASLGINHVSLFPNLDSLSKTIMDEHWNFPSGLSVPSLSEQSSKAQEK